MSMINELKLVNVKDVAEKEVMKFQNEFFSSGERFINGSRGLHNYENYNDWIQLVKECEKPDNKLLGVQATTYFGVQKTDEKIVGCIELRHTINEELKIIGGHVGYSVSPKERRKGYATNMLQLVLDEARKLGIDKLLLTCDVDNIGSNRTVLNCGGELERQEPYQYHGSEYYKYWINV